MEPASSLQLQETNGIQRPHARQNELASSAAPPLQQDFSLPPVDGGRAAWLFLAGSFAIEALVWGFPFSFGLFQAYYSTHEPFASQPSGIAAIGTTAMGTMYLAGGVYFALLQLYPRIRRPSCAIGLVVLAIALVSSSFAQSVWQLVLTQGVLYGIGGSLLYCPVILFMDEWFVRRKGLGFGVMWAGTGFSGISIPYLMSWGLSHYTFRTMLRMWSLVVVLLAGPLLYFVRPRIPISQVTAVRKFDLKFALGRKFLVLQAANILEGLGYFVPGIYLPTYARSLGLNSAETTATVAMLNGAAVFGCVFVGILIDRYHVTTVILVSTIGAVFAVFVFWGLSASVPLLLVFSTAYGFFAGSFTSTWTGVIKEVKKTDHAADTGMIFGFLAAGRGIGSVACGPLSEALLRERIWEGEARLGYGSGYGGLIVFTGVTALLGGLSFGARRVGWL